MRVLIVLGVLAAAPHAAAACQWYGTQLECEVGVSRVVIGTQTAGKPTYARPFGPQSFHGNDGLLDHHAALRLPFEVELQDFSADPRLCRKIGNETYCY